MSEPITTNVTTSTDEAYKQYYAEFKEMLNQPWKSPEQIEAERQAEEQNNLAQEQAAVQARLDHAAQLKTAFDQTPTGVRLRQERDQVYGKLTLDKLSEGMMQNSDWYRETMGIIVDVVMADNEKYRALLHFYDDCFKDYVRSQPGGQAILDFLKTQQ